MVQLVEQLRGPLKVGLCARPWFLDDGRIVIQDPLLWLALRADGNLLEFDGKVLLEEGWIMHEGLSSPFVIQLSKRHETGISEVHPSHEVEIRWLHKVRDGGAVGPCE